VADDITPTVLLETWDENGTQYTTFAEIYDGNWSITDNIVTFTPGQALENGNGGNVGISYQLSDGNGHTSNGGINIHFPAIVEANWDNVDKDSVETTTLNILENDTVAEGVTPELKLIYWNSNALEELNTSVETDEGNWSVSGQNVTFMPSTSFRGGTAYIEYQLSDGDGHTSRAGINMNFPILLAAQYDQITKATLEETTIDVLANDTLIDDATPTVLLSHYGENGQEYVTSIENNDGNWTVIDNQIIFTPSSNCGGGRLYRSYQLSDQYGHKDISSIEIQFPSYVEAHDDTVTLSGTDYAYINVIENDIFPSGSIQNTSIYDTINDTYNYDITTDDGYWYAMDGSINFEPNNTFTGNTTLSITYKISDDNQNESTATLTIIYQ
jgi:hypothetical protein